MNIEELRKYCLSKKGSSESFPFDETTLVFKVMNKMFAITDLEDDFAVVIKAEPEDILHMREKYPAVKPPRYFDKRYWNHIMIDGSIESSLIRQWIDESYDLIVKKLPKRDQKALEEH
jgi:predicted DNA-binding protein (MmcQ/YjbR family)